jgi:hypothetical protein
MSLRWAVLFVILLEVLVAVWAVMAYGWDLDGLQATTRFSGRLSLVLFSIIFLFSERNQSLTRPVLSDKPYTAFAIAHGIHLIELLFFVWISKQELIPYRLDGGFLAYALIFIMPYVHHQYSNGAITKKKFRNIHIAYIYYVWLIFFMSYLPRVLGKLPNVGGSYPEFVALLAWVCMLLGAKVGQALMPTRHNV